MQDFYDYLAMQTGFEEVNLTIAERLQDVLFAEVRNLCGSLMHPRPILGSSSFFSTLGYIAGLQLSGPLIIRFRIGHAKLFPLTSILHMRIYKLHFIIQIILLVWIHVPRNFP